MNKITTVLIAMLLLTLTILTAGADQNGNERWCNIDSHGCYLNEEGGTRSYMYFWTEESCRYFMGNDNPCKNVVDFYTEDKYRLPLEPAPEPVVHQPQPEKNPAIEISLMELYELFFPNGIAIFNGVLLSGENISGREFIMSPSSGTEVLIPVYVPNEGNDINMVDTLSYPTENGSFLLPFQADVPDYVSGALNENYTFAGFVPAESVSFDRDMIEKMNEGNGSEGESGLTASMLDPIGVEDDEEGNVTGLILFGNSSFGGSIGTNSGQGTSAIHTGEIYSRKDSDNTSQWYGGDSSIGSVPQGKLVAVRWIIDETNEGSPGDISAGQITAGNGGTITTGQITAGNRGTVTAGTLTIGDGGTLRVGNLGVISGGQFAVGNGGALSGGQLTLGNGGALSVGDGGTLRVVNLGVVSGGQPASTVWNGGANDQYNKPDIYMNGNSALYLNADNGSVKNGVFSFYGTIGSSENDLVLNKGGKIFGGRLQIAKGAKFQIISADNSSGGSYEGKFPNANIYQGVNGVNVESRVSGTVGGVRTGEGLPSGDPALNGRYESQGTSFIVKTSPYLNVHREFDVNIEDGVTRIIEGAALAEKVTGTGVGQRLYVYPINSNAYETLAEAN